MTCLVLVAKNGTHTVSEKFSNPLVVGENPKSGKKYRAVDYDDFAKLLYFHTYVEMGCN